MIEVRLIKVTGQSAVVTFRDKDGMIQGRIISRDAIDGLKIGGTKPISNKTLSTGIEYGIDWDVLLGHNEYVITPADIGNELRRRGLWNYDDINKNPIQATAALNALSHKVLAHLLGLARELK